MNPAKPNQFDETEFFGIMRIASDRPVSLGLKVRIDRIHFGLTGFIRIDFD